MPDLNRASSFMRSPMWHHGIVRADEKIVANDVKPVLAIPAMRGG